MNLSRTALVAGLLGVLVKSSASAQGLFTAHDSFGPGTTYDYSAALQLGGTDMRAAFSFTPRVSGNLYSIELPLTTDSAAGSAQVLLCRTDPATGFPSAPLELFSATGLMPIRVDSTPVAPLSFRSSSEPVLDAFAKYWLVVAAPPSSDVGPFVNWYATTDHNAISPFYFLSETEGEGFRMANPPSAFRITITTVPEPSIVALAIMAGAMAILLRRIR